MFRPLTADEVECRVAQVGKKQNGGVYASFLIYKDALYCDLLSDIVIKITARYDIRKLQVLPGPCVMSDPCQVS